MQVFRGWLHTRVSEKYPESSSRRGRESKLLFTRLDNSATCSGTCQEAGKCMKVYVYVLSHCLAEVLPRWPKPPPASWPSPRSLPISQVPKCCAAVLKSMNADQGSTLLGASHVWQEADLRCLSYQDHAPSSLGAVHSSIASAYFLRLLYCQCPKMEICKLHGYRKAFE